MNLPHALDEECFEPSRHWFKFRLSLWLIVVAVLIGGAIGAAYWPVWLIALALLIVPISLLVRDASTYTSQRIALVYFDVEIRHGLFVANHPTFSLFEVQFDYKQSLLGKWLNYGDAIFHRNGAGYRLHGIHNVRGLSRSIALRRAIVLRSLQHRSQDLAPSHYGGDSALQVGGASVFQNLADEQDWLSHVVPTKRTKVTTDPAGACTSSDELMYRTPGRR